MNECFCCGMKLCFGKVGVTVVVGSLFDGPLSRIMFFGPSHPGHVAA